MAYIHERGVVHRDVQPSNVLLVGTDGDLRLLDFNVAAHDGGTSECVTPVGDVLYRAPEVGSDVRGYGFEADIWGIGATLYFSLAGHFKRKKIFQDAEWQIVPDALREPVAACLQKEPACRPTAAVLQLSLSEKLEFTAPAC